MPTASPDVGDKWPEVKTKLCNGGVRHSQPLYYYFQEDDCYAMGVQTTRGG